MSLYELAENEFRPISQTTFRDVNIQERANLQRLLREQVEIIAPGCLVIAEEFGEWDESRRRIDLLAVDSDANLVVIELKRTEDGGHMELQAIRYASMVSLMTFEQAVRAYTKFLDQLGKNDQDAETNILEHLGWESPEEELFGVEVRIVLASAEFSKELTSTVLWLNDRGLDISCMRLSPHDDNGRILVDVQQVIPLPEAEEHQIRVREKTQRERESRRSSRDLTKYKIRLGREELGPLAKRETVLRVVQYICGQGVTPEEILAAVTIRKTNSFRRISGDFLTTSELIEAAARDSEARGRVFDRRRWYCELSDSIKHDGCSYVLSNQWGSRAIEWLEQVIEAFPGHSVEIFPVGNP